MNACLYLRKSRKDDDLGETAEEILSRQESILLALAAKRGDTIVKIYREVVSGETISARPQVQNLIRDVENGLYGGVYVTEATRLSRGDVLDQGIVTRAFQLSHTVIITPNKVYDPNDEFDNEYFEFDMLMSRREYNTIKRRLQRGRKQSQIEGKIIGPAPYGYRKVKLTGQKGYTLEFDPNEEACMKMIVKLICDDEMGYTAAADKLNYLGFSTRTGGSWTASALRSIAKSPLNIGMVPVGKQKYIKRMINGKVVTCRTKNPESYLVKGMHPPYMTEDQYKRACRQRAPVPSGINQIMRNPLSGLVVCSKCGLIMQRAKGSYYREADMLFCPRKGCGTVGSKISRVESVLVESLSEILEAYKSNPQKVDQDNLQPFYDALDALDREMKELKKQKTRQFELLEKGLYDEDTFLERSKEVSDSINALDEKIKILKTEIGNSEARSARLEAFVPKCEDLLAHYYEWDVETRNTVLKELLAKVEYTKERRNTLHEKNEAIFSLKLCLKLT